MFKSLLNIVGLGPTATGRAPVNSGAMRAEVQQVHAKKATHIAARSGANGSRQVKKTSEPDNQAPSELKPTKNEAISIITSADNVTYKSIATTLGGPFEIGEAMQSHLACLEVGVNEYTILVTRAFYKNNQHITLRKRVEKVGGKIVRESLIEEGAIRILYSKFEQSNVTEMLSADNPELTARVEKMVGEAVNRRATDIHICPRFDTADRTGAVLFRIDGSLRVWDKFPAEDLNLVVGYMYTKMAGESSRSDPAYNQKKMQSCSLDVAIDNSIVRIRYQTVAVNGGFDCILRLLVLDKSDVNLSLDQLGYCPSQIHQLDLASRKTVGVIIIAGVTGSGKSTTLKTLMTMSPRRHLVKSYSIEDPVEYKIYGVSQIGVQRSSADQSSANPYLETMRVIMRADPDVIMPGEVRDIQSCQMLQTMVQSGHQVMTTVHASSAIEILDRVTSEQMGLSRHTLSSKNFISALVYQRLIPLLCPKCKKPAEEVVPEDRLDILETKFGVPRKGLFAAHEVENDCPHCKGTGIKGMTVAAEIITPDVQFLRLLREGKDSEAEEYWRMGRKAPFTDPDMTGKTAFEHGLYKVSQGLVDPRHLEDNFDPMETYYVMDIRK